MLNLFNTCKTLRTSFLRIDFCSVYWYYPHHLPKLMPSLRFNGDVSLEEIFSQHKTLIYESVVKAIEENYRDPNLKEVEVLSIHLNGIDHAVNLSRSKFIDGLHNAIDFYEKLEEYEKCQHCLDIINEMKKKSYISK